MERLSKSSTREIAGGKALLYCDDSQKLYSSWDTPTAIIVDGPYGLASFPGDPPTPHGLPTWYEPHVKAWTRYSTPQTTLWFWNSELGWATVHPLLVANGWEFRSCHIWDKGLAHIAGNANTKTLRKFPVVTEVCVQYTRTVTFSVNDAQIPMKDWLRLEWERSGIPLYKANAACGVANAATRKYLTKDHLWYFPPSEMFQALQEYANTHGIKSGRPYFSADGIRPISKSEWGKMRAKFNCPIGITNVWSEPPVNGRERLKSGAKCVHMNQKPIKLLSHIIRACTEVGDVVWDPFAGLCSVAATALRTGRKSFSAEINPEYFAQAYKRLQSEAKTLEADAHVTEPIPA